MSEGEKARWTRMGGVVRTVVDRCGRTSLVKFMPMGEARLQLPPPDRVELITLGPEGAVSSPGRPGPQPHMVCRGRPMDPQDYEKVDSTNLPFGRNLVMIRPPVFNPAQGVLFDPFGFDQNGDKSLETTESPIPDEPVERDSAGVEFPES